MDTIKDKDFLYAGSYLDYNYADIYGYFNKDDIITKVGKTVQLTYKAGSSLGSDYEIVVPVKDAEIKMMNISNAKIVKLKGAKTAKFKDGKITLNFKTAGLYFIAITGSGTYDNGWSGEVTGKLASQLAAIEVKPGKPAIKKAKRTAKKKAVVTWKKVKGAGRYIVEYKKDGAKKWKTKYTKKTKITLKKLDAKKKYKVRVYAGDKDGFVESKPSKAKTIKVKK